MIVTWKEIILPNDLLIEKLYPWGAKLSLCSIYWIGIDGGSRCKVYACGEVVAVLFMVVMQKNCTVYRVLSVAKRGFIDDDSKFGTM
ncbi:hypothetical protein NECAME_09585 [Necator americanus]|uniref:Uncharacterized protein n=1 Tax=Necator americanus TaxID=51031 RepID=W2TCR7_NECAM|nr:hypothetical protein NECAME_09585 [Necator americanus]ETN79830.1 hypothetical protein NECAME_09585 [Necator americanus]